MKCVVVRVALLVACVILGQAQDAVPRPQERAGSIASSTSPRALLDQYCVTCHNERLKTSGLAIDTMDPARVADDAGAWEKVVRKLRAGMMPPQGRPRPDHATYEALAVALENELDRAAEARPKLVEPAVHRINRTEYANAIRDILGLEIDPAVYLPADDASYGFDNVASGLQISPALVEGYVSAASKLSRLALGRETAPERKMYFAREDYSQEDQIEGLPFGTRGGIVANHYFPAGGEYIISWVPVRNTVGTLYGGDSENEQVELSIDGERLKLYEIGKDIPLSANVQADKNEVRVPVEAGYHTVGVSFIANTYIPHVFLNRAYRRSILDGNPVQGIMQSPQISQLVIHGPMNGVRSTDAPGRRKILTCAPSAAVDAETCARMILRPVARKAYRRPITAADTGTLMSFFDAGRETGDFEAGIERGLQFILSHPEFIFRTERVPDDVKPGQPYRIPDLELAARLASFLWSTVPDDDLISAAAQGSLKDPAVLERQVRRMLQDVRSRELVNNFAGQWLGLRMLQSSTPEGTIYPDFDDNLRQAMRTETEMFFESIVREDRSVLDLLTADYTYVNERLAVHYGIPNIYGTRFRRVTLDGTLDVRRGLIGKGSVLLVTSNSDRTSPVLRGKWVMENILGSIPPDPPPNVPALKPARKSTAAETMRQRMEAHWSNPACSSCHRMMDPIGFALENFDGVGKWRTTENGQNVDASGELVDGTPVDGVIRLRQALLRYSPQFARVVTEKLLTYALARGVEYDDMPAVRFIVREAARQDYRFSAIVMAIVKSQPFQMRRAAKG